MNESVKRELTVVMGNIILLKIAGEARKAGRISEAEMTVVANAMSILLDTYQKMYPVTELDSMVDDKATKH